MRSKVGLIATMEEQSHRTLFTRICHWEMLAKCMVLCQSSVLTSYSRCPLRPLAKNAERRETKLCALGLRMKRAPMRCLRVMSLAANITYSLLACFASNSASRTCKAVICCSADARAAASACKRASSSRGVSWRSLLAFPLCGFRACSGDFLLLLYGFCD